MRITAILCVRNEAAFLLDWLAHHRACGVTDFLIYSNDCQDGTDTLLDRLAARGLVQHRANPGPYDERGVQFTALKAAENEPVVQQADWLLPLDVDEFVNVHVGQGTLPDLIGSLPQATAITLTWRLFGNGGVVQYADTPVTQQFTRAAPKVMYWPWRASMFKTLYRNDGTYGALGVHRPRRPDQARLASAQWFDGSGRDVSELAGTQRVFSTYGRDNYGLAQLNHYPLGSMESYVLKTDRGRAVHADQRLAMDYWVERNFCTEEDNSILALSETVAAIRAELADDAQTAQLHQAAVAWRKARFNDLMAQEPNRALLGRLMMTPPTQPVPKQAAQFLLHHARRANAPKGGSA